MPKKVKKAKESKAYSSQNNSKLKTRRKPNKGNPKGSRNNTSKGDQKAFVNNHNVDPRHGSKKLVPLGVMQSEKTFSSPHQELLDIESDVRLAALIEQSEQGKKLRFDQQQYMDERLSRHALLCELLGFSDEDKGDSYPLNSIDAISIADYQE